MNKGLKWALISLPILIGGFIVYKTLRPQKPKQDTPPPPSPIPSGGGTPSGGGGGYTPPPKADFPIGLGSKGAKVKELQQAIVDDGQANIVSLLGANPTDGKFGTGTEKAVKALLGKTKIDSQADIDNIKKLKAQRIANQTAAQAATQGDANRKFYGNLIVNGLCKSGKELYSVNSAGKIFGYKFDSTKTRQIESKSWTYGKGERAKPWNYCSNIKSQTLDNAGFVEIWTVESGNNWKYRFTPYDFEVK